MSIMIVKRLGPVAAIPGAVAGSLRLLPAFIASVAMPIAAHAAVIEFFNPDLNNYFITADPVEQAFVDTGAVGRWQRTGEAFGTGGSNQVCRFFGNGNINPATGTFFGPNSHFYTADPAECAGLKTQFRSDAKSWKFESNDFLITPATNGNCPSGLVPVYRAYNNGFTRGVDSNHRITSNYGSYLQTVLAGSIGEGVVMCAVSGNPIAAQNSALALGGIAFNIYDALTEKQDLKPTLASVMAAFGVPQLGAADAATADARLSQGLPLMFIPQIAEMADAFNDGGYISLDAFIAAANGKGAIQKGSANPLTRAYLDQKFAALAGKTQYAPGEALPAFVLALGKERAKRFPPATPDVLWGDNLLDPLQLTLMLYAVSYSSATQLPDQLPAQLPDQASVSVRAAPKASILAARGGNPLEDYVKDQINDKFTDKLQDVVGIPLDKTEAAKVSVCASLLLYGHKLKVTALPKLIYHHQSDGDVPWTTEVNSLLTFQDDYWDNYAPIDHWLLNNLGNCDLPRRGPIAGKPLEYSVSDGLTAHGSFDLAPPATNDAGKSLATWRAVLETTPKDQRTFANQLDAVGAVIVRAGNLVPGWSTLERIVGVLKDSGNTGDAPLTVIFYKSTKGWTGTGSSTGAVLATAKAQVTWTYESEVNNVVKYYPLGTVAYTLVAPGCTISPSTDVIGRTDGSLYVDFNASPPTYHGSGETHLLTSITCSPLPASPVGVGGVFLGGSKGPNGNEAQGSVSADGTTIEGNDNATQGGSPINVTWKFTRDK